MVHRLSLDELTRPRFAIVAPSSNPSTPFASPSPSAIVEEIDVWLYGSLAFVAVGMVLIPVGESSDTPALTTTGIVAVSGGGLTALVNLGMRASIGFGK